MTYMLQTGVGVNKFITKCKNKKELFFDPPVCQKSWVMLPVASWLLCIWQARRAQAPWWAVLLTILCVLLSKMVLDKVSSESSEIIRRGWPELLRAAVSFTLTAYVMQTMLLEIEPSGRITGAVMMVVVAASLMDYKEPSGNITWIFTLAAIVGVVLREWGPYTGGNTTHGAGFTEWLQFLLSMHALLVGHVVPYYYYATEHPKRQTVSVVRGLCALSVSVFATRGSIHTGSFLHFIFLLPTLSFKQKHAVSTCITPMLDHIYHPDLYPIKDQKKAEARRILLMQQKQDILIYLMAWCMVMGLWAHMRPSSVLLAVQVIGAVMYLASLRRYSNHVLNLSQFFAYSARRAKLSQAPLRRTAKDAADQKEGNKKHATPPSQPAILTINQEAMARMMGQQQA